MPLADFKTGTKQCSKCGEIKPLSEFYREKTLSDGLSCWCRKCCYQRAADWRKRNPGKRNEWERKSRAANIENRLLKEAAWRAKNRDRINALDRAWYERTKRRRRLVLAVWRRENREHINQQHRAWSDKHRDQCRRNSERCRKANPQAAVARQHKRRAQKAKTGGSYSIEDIKRQLAVQKHRCWWCNKKLNGKYHVDHWFPISRGGRNDAENIVISCPHCNWSKGAKTPEEFARTLF